jgi:Kef-type K+ transport system membrane component KefB
MEHAGLLVQLVVILTASRTLAWLLRRLGQPRVIGEMLAGLALGPMLLGALAPQWQQWLFAPQTLPALDALSQVGLVLFMLIVGAELRLPTGSRHALRTAGAVGVLAVLLPMGLGLLIAPSLQARFAPPGVGFWPFAMFLAAAIGITAMPVLARILKDSGRTHTPVGQLALASAAVADVLAWLALAGAMAMASSQGDWTPFWRALLGVVAMLVLCLGVLRPWLAWLLRRHGQLGRPDGYMLAVLLVGTFACGALTHWMHLHAVFGAFLFGAALPRNDTMLASLIVRLENITVIALLPVFFALAGLSTTVTAFGAHAVIPLLLILLVAVGGKLLGGTLGARLGGYRWRESLAVGSLMNARGMMELIVLKVGLDAGVLGNDLFTILLLIAIITTMMSTPMLLALDRRPVAQRPVVPADTLRHAPPLD